MNVLENSIKEEVISMLITNSLRNLNEKRIKEIISEMDLNETIASYFNVDDNNNNCKQKHLKIQGKSNKIKKQQDEKFLNKKRNDKQIKLVTACPHQESKHYAKNMCYNCYHREGRAKKAWACKHINRSHYAHGMCHNCYQTNHIEKIKQSIPQESN
jgi:hypothetical protein